jgi:hypothetical protein
MATLGRIAKLRLEQPFAIYHDGVLVANATTVAGLDDALSATVEARFDPSVYIPGLHVAGLATATATEWFVAWRGSGGKRNLAVRDREHERTILVRGAFIAAWKDGSWCDLVLDGAVVVDGTAT